MQGPASSAPLTIGTLAQQIRRCRDFGFSIEQLRALERSLAKFVSSRTSVCAGGPAPRCTTSKDLGWRNCAGLSEPSALPGVGQASPPYAPRLAPVQARSLNPFV